MLFCILLNSKASEVFIKFNKKYYKDNTKTDECMWKYLSLPQYFTSSAYAGVLVLNININVRSVYLHIFPVREHYVEYLCACKDNYLHNITLRITVKTQLRVMLATVDASCFNFK